MQVLDVPKDAPDMIVEDFSFKRTIDSRDWNVAAVSAEHRDGIVNISDIVVSIDEPSARRNARFIAVSGDFLRDRSVLTLYDVQGIAMTGSMDADVDASKAKYDSESDVWLFDSGVAISTDEAIFNSGAASIDKQGIIFFESGVVTEWKED